MTGIRPSLISASRRRVFDPLSLSPALWLSDTGSSAGTWPDISGNGRDATQATPANQPAIITNALNGRQARRFDGTDDFLTIAYRSIFRDVSGATIIAVCKPTSLGSSERAIFTNTVGTSLGARANLAVDNPAQPGGWQYGGRRLDADSGDFNQSASDYNGSSFYVATAQYRYADAEKQLWINGGSEHIDTSFQTAGNASNTDSSADTHIGSTATPAGFFQGDIAEILIFPTALSTADRQRVESYLSQKYNIALA
jgi:hypothetical protein